MWKVSSLVFISFVNAVLSDNFPSFIPRCKFEDVDCIKKTVSIILTQYPTGIPELGLVSLDPYYVGSINQTNIASTNRLLSASLFQIKDTTLVGFKDSTIVNAEFTRKGKQQKALIVLAASKITIKGKYLADGQITVFPIKGEGPFHIDLINATFTVKGMSKLEKQGDQEYMKIKKLRCTFEFEDTKIKIDNLFEGDQALSETVSQFISANSKELFNYISQQVFEGVSMYLKDHIQILFDKFSFNELYIW